MPPLKAAPTLPYGKAVYIRDRQRRLLKSETFDGLFQSYRDDAAFAAIIARLPGQRCEAELPILRDPPLRRAARNPRRPRHRLQGLVLLKVRVTSDRRMAIPSPARLPAGRSNLEENLLPPPLVGILRFGRITVTRFPKIFSRRRLSPLNRLAPLPLISYPKTRCLARYTVAGR